MGRQPSETQMISFGNVSRVHYLCDGDHPDNGMVLVVEERAVVDSVYAPIVNDARDLEEMLSFLYTSSDAMEEAGGVECLEGGGMAAQESCTVPLRDRNADTSLAMREALFMAAQESCIMHSVMHASAAQEMVDSIASQQSCTMPSRCTNAGVQGCCNE